MKKKLFRNNLLVLVLGFMLCSSAVGSFAASASADTSPDFDTEWRLRVDGFVNNTLDLSISDLAAMPRTVQYAELYCYGNLVITGDWAGVRVGLLLEKAGINSSAIGVEFRASDGYKMGASIEDPQQKNLIIAYELNGQPLPEKLRLVCPGENGAAWIALITQMAVVGLDPVPATPSPPISSPPQEPSTPQVSPTSQPTVTPQTETVKQPEPATEPVLTPQQPENQSTAQPTVPPADSQSGTQVVSGVPLGFDYAVVGVFVAVLVVMTGYLAWKRKK